MGPYDGDHRGHGVRHRPVAAAGILAAIALVTFVSGPGCRNADPRSVRVVDLLQELTRAEMRPAPAAFALMPSPDPARPRPAIVTSAPSRLIYTLAIPRRAVFRASVALDGAAAPIRFRVGVSDDRVYELLAQATAMPAAGPIAWTDLQADLSAYAGWKWSLFYRPERRLWRLVLSTDAVGGVGGRALWGAPGIDTSNADARAYAKRLAAGRT